MHMRMKRPYTRAQRNVMSEMDVPDLDMTMKEPKITSVKHLQVGEGILEYPKRAAVGQIASKVN